MKTKNLTISLDEDLLKASRRYAKLKGTSINELFRDFLKNKVVGEPSSKVADELLEALSAAEGNSNSSNNKGRQWERKDAYSR